MCYVALSARQLTLTATGESVISDADCAFNAGDFVVDLVLW